MVPELASILLLAVGPELRPSILNGPHSSTLPTTCNVGDEYQDSDAASGCNFYLCYAANTWVRLGLCSTDIDTISEINALTTDADAVTTDGTAQTISAAKTISEGSNIRWAFKKTATSGSTDSTMEFQNSSGLKRLSILEGSGGGTTLLNAWNVSGVKLFSINNAGDLTIGPATDIDHKITFDRASTDSWFMWDEQATQNRFAMNFGLDMSQADTNIATVGDGDGFDTQKNIIQIPYHSGIYGLQADGTTLAHIIGIGRDSVLEADSICTAFPSGICPLGILGSREISSWHVVMSLSLPLRDAGMDGIGQDLIDWSDVGNKVGSYNTRLVQYLDATTGGRSNYVSLATAPSNNTSPRCSGSNGNFSEANRECNADSRLTVRSGDENVDVEVTHARFKGGDRPEVEFASGQFDALGISSSNRSTNNYCLYADMGNGTNGDLAGSNVTITQQDTAQDHGWGTYVGSMKMAFDNTGNFGGSSFQTKCSQATGVGDRIAFRAWVFSDTSLLPGIMNFWTNCADGTCDFEGYSAGTIPDIVGENIGGTYDSPAIPAYTWTEVRYLSPPMETTESGVFPVISRFGGSAATAFNLWVDDIQMSVISATAISSVSTGADELTVSSASTIKTGDVVTYTSTSTAITGLTDGANYYAIRTAATIIKLATTRGNAMAGTAIDLTGSGAGTQSLAPVVEVGPWIPTDSLAITEPAGVRIRQVYGPADQDGHSGMQSSVSSGETRLTGSLSAGFSYIYRTDADNDGNYEDSVRYGDWVGEFSLGGYTAAGGGLTPTGTGANVLSLYEFRLTALTKFDRISINIDTAFTSQTNTCSAAIYGRPDSSGNITKIVEASAQDYTSTGVKTMTVSTTQLEPGVYYFGTGCGVNTVGLYESARVNDYIMDVRQIGWGGISSGVAPTPIALAGQTFTGGNAPWFEIHLATSGAKF